LIAAAFAMLAFAIPASAQKDAAEKAKEGGIEHWIEYYKSTQPKPSTPPAQESVNQIKHGERAGSDTPLLEKTNDNK
jgi:hypothetical protein